MKVDSEFASKYIDLFAALDTDLEGIRKGKVVSATGNDRHEAKQEENDDQEQKKGPDGPFMSGERSLECGPKVERPFPCDQPGLPSSK